MYIILSFYTFVNDYASNTSKNINEFSGAAHETSSGVPKLSQIILAKHLTNPQKFVKLSITLLYPAQALITLALHICTGARVIFVLHFCTCVGAVHASHKIIPAKTLFIRGLHDDRRPLHENNCIYLGVCIDKVEWV